MLDSDQQVPVLEYASPPPESIPGELKVVAWLFIGFGILSGLEVLWSLTAGRISLNLGLLGIFVGIGLLRLRNGWRICGLVMLTLALLLGVLAVVLTVISGMIIAVAISVILLAVTVWAFGVLTRSDVRRLFGTL